MKVKVLIFGPLRDVTGSNVCEIADVNNTNELVERMNSLYPDLRQKKYLIAVEKEIVQSNTTLYNNFTVALLPPYSGG